MKVTSNKSPEQDILCKVDKVHLEVLNIHSIKVRCDLSYLTIIVPESLIPPFQDFLQSALSISRYIKTRVSVGKAIQKTRDVSYQAEQKKRFEKYSVRIISQFDKFIDSGLPVRQAIRQTKEALNQGGSDLTCYTIQLIVREAGRLSKRKKKTGVETMREGKGNKSIP